MKKKKNETPFFSFNSIDPRIKGPVIVHTREEDTEKEREGNVSNVHRSNLTVLEWPPENKSTIK